MPTKARAQRIAYSAALINAARRWRVPLWVLVGVKLAETGTGTGLGEESSAGAQGPFQFIPSTAAAYNVNVNSFASSANGAARYLHDLHRSAGSWDAALYSYSGGGYGRSHIEDRLSEAGLSKAELGGEGQVTIGFLGDLKHTLDKAFGWALGGLAGHAATQKGVEEHSLGGIAGGLFPHQLIELLESLVDPNTYLRALEVIGGAVLIYIGLKSLTGVSASDLPGAGLAARAPLPLAV